MLIHRARSPSSSSLIGEMTMYVCFLHVFRLPANSGHWILAYFVIFCVVVVLKIWVLCVELSKIKWLAGTMASQVVGLDVMWLDGEIALNILAFRTGAIVSSVQCSLLFQVKNAIIRL